MVLTNSRETFRREKELPVAQEGAVLMPSNAFKSPCQDRLY